MELAIGHWFGHYDSRGGSTLILGAPSDEDALVFYVEEVFCTNPNDEWYEDYLNSLKLELMRTLVVRIIDPIDFENKYDLLYGEVEIAWGLVSKDAPDRAVYKDGDVWICDDANCVLEIWVGDYTKMVEPEGFKIANLGHFGEDAYGMIAQKWKKSRFIK